MSAFVDLVRRDLRLATRLGGSALTGVLFFLTVVTVIPFGVGPDMALMARIGPAILWIGALLATLLSLDRLFEALPDAQQRAIELVKIEGLSISEASATTGQSESLVKVNIHRGLRRLAALIERI